MALKATTRRSYRTLPPGGADGHATASAVNLVMNGKLNATGTVTLPSGSTTATLRHPSIGIQSIILPQALTIAARGFAWAVTDRVDGAATVSYAALGADTEIEYLVIG